MKRKLRFVWIDDNPENEEEALNLQKRLDINMLFESTEGRDPFPILDRVRDGSPVDLILIDHRLTEAARPMIGSTAAEYLREKLPDRPIVCVTAAGLDEVDSHKRSLYEKVVEIDKLSDSDSAFIAIAQSFSRMRTNPPENTQQLIDYLKPPKDDRERLEAVIPDEIKAGYKDKGSLLLLISEWVRNTLMKRPGFLYDRLWTATLLGIQQESFSKVEHLFEKAKYSGVFGHEGAERWWQTKIRSILASLVNSDKIMLPWEMGRLLPDIAAKDHSRCHLSKEDFPETVAYIDESATDRAPIRLRYTVRHPRFEDALFFEEIRMMKGRE